MGQAGVVGTCTAIENCAASVAADSGREQISTGPVELREKTYVTARAVMLPVVPVQVFPWGYTHLTADPPNRGPVRTAGS